MIQLLTTSDTRKPLSNELPSGDAYSKWNPIDYKVFINIYL